MAQIITYSLDSYGRLVHIDSVQNGLKCYCKCPNCSRPMVAKNGGLDRVHHFAHADGHECTGAYETTMHLLAKEILMEEKRVMLPVAESPSDLSGMVMLHDVKKEPYDTLIDIKPDVEGVLDNGERLLVEFLVSHKVDDRKRGIIYKNNLKCIEIDLNSQPMDRVTLTEFITSSTDDREWIKADKKVPLYVDVVSEETIRNPYFDRIRNRLIFLFEHRDLVIRPKASLMPTGDPRIDKCKSFRLRGELHYDKCDVDGKYNGTRYDLLLSRSTEPESNKGYIAICIRGRGRDKGYTCPPRLRIIDIIIGQTNPAFAGTEMAPELMFKHVGIDRRNGNVKIQYWGFTDKQARPVLLDTDMLHDLLRQAQESNTRESTYDLSSSEKDKGHKLLRMLEAVHKTDIHRNEKATETIFVISGKCNVLLYEEIKNGFTEYQSEAVGPNEDVKGIQIPKGTWHSIEAVVPSIILELKGE